ncbi:MAG: acetyltransferase [Flavobacteriales bacterium]
MIVVGAGGHAKEVADEWVKNGRSLNDIEFFDDVTGKVSLLDRPVHGNMGSIGPGQEFIIAVGDPTVREKLYNVFIRAGHNPINIQAHSAEISSLNTILGHGLNIMAGVVIGPNVKVDDGVLLNSGVHLHHDSSIGEFCEISPRVSILGEAQVERKVRIGTGAIILPGIVIGQYAVVGAGALVDRNVPPHTTVVGIPARPIDRT